MIFEFPKMIMPFFKRVIKNILIQVLYYSGLPVLFREFIQRGKVTILVCHDPGVAVASEYFRWLSLHYNVISLGQFLSARAGNGMDSLPRKSLVITLDDGYSGNYKLLPLVKKYDVPVTIFLCSGIIDTKRHYWFKYTGLPFSSETLKVIPQPDRLKILAESGFYPEKEFECPQALNKVQISEMKEYIDFQSHTIFHPCLPQCSDEESRIEIEQSKKQLEQQFNLSINAFAYPNGDYTKRDIQITQKAGYTCALTVDHGFNDAKTGLYRLKRLSVSDRDGIKLLAIKASGIWSFLKYAFNSRTRAKRWN